MPPPLLDPRQSITWIRPLHLVISINTFFCSAPRNTRSFVCMPAAQTHSLQVNASEGDTRKNVRLPTRPSSRAQIHLHALHIRMSSFAITAPNLKAGTESPECDSGAVHTRPRQLVSAETTLHHARTCSRKTNTRHMHVQYAGLARPICKPFRAEVSGFLGLHFKKSDLSLFSASSSRLSRSETRAAGSFAGCGDPAYLYCAIYFC